MGAGVGAGAGAGVGAIAGAGADIEVAVAGAARKSDRFSRASSPGDRPSRDTEDGAGSIRAAPRVRSADRSPSSDAGAPAEGAATAHLKWGDAEAETCGSGDTAQLAVTLAVTLAFACARTRVRSCSLAEPLPWRTGPL